MILLSCVRNFFSLVHIITIELWDLKILQLQLIDSSPDISSNSSKLGESFLSIIRHISQRQKKMVNNNLLRVKQIEPPTRPKLGYSLEKHLKNVRKSIIYFPDPNDHWKTAK